MMRISRTRTRTRARARTHVPAQPGGFAIFAVLLAMTLVALISASLQSAIWRATRQSRIALSGERALHAADAAIASHIAQWNARDFAAMALGERKTQNRHIGTGLDALVTLARTAPDAAVIEAIATATEDGSPIPAQRRLSRAVVLRTPPLPLQAVLTTLGPAVIADPLGITAIDQAPPGWTNECDGVANTGPAWATPLSTTTAQAQFDASWSQLSALASRLDDAAALTSLSPIPLASVCTPGTGEPLRGAGSVTQCSNEWGARLVTNAHPAHITGNNRHQGVLLIDGDFLLSGNLEVNGLLIVRGAINASAGSLTVNGAVLVRDQRQQGSHFGNSTRVRYSRCALRRALSAISFPASVATRSWLERS